MESEFENFLSRQHLNHVRKTKSGYFMNVSEIQPRLFFFVNGSDNLKRNIVIFLKMALETSAVITNHGKN